MEYPLMLFKGGELTAEYRIVDDKAGEDAAKADGFIRAGAALEGQSIGDEKAELIAKLEAAGITFDKRWGVDKLRAALEGQPE